MGRKNEYTTRVDNIIAGRIRDTRISLGITREKLGNYVGVSHQQMQKYENATNRISAGRLMAIAQSLGKQVSFFFEDIEAPIELNSNHENMRNEIINNFIKIKDPVEHNAINSLTKGLEKAQ